MRTFGEQGCKCVIRILVVVGYVDIIEDGSSNLLQLLLKTETMYYTMTYLTTFSKKGRDCKDSCTVGKGGWGWCKDF